MTWHDDDELDAREEARRDRVHDEYMATHDVFVCDLCGGYESNDHRTHVKDTDGRVDKVCRKCVAEFIADGEIFTDEDGDNHQYKPIKSEEI